MKPKVVDLFCGCGGLSLGFEKAGFQVAMAVDNWEPALDIYRKNFPTHRAESLDLSGDEAVRRIAGEKPDLIVGGPPCQDFSSAGKRDESLGRANLTISFAGIIAKVKPAWFVMENVPRAAKSAAYQRALEIFEAAGYKVSSIVLDASLCGVPQKRQRFFAVGDLKGCSEEAIEFMRNGLSDSPMTLRDYFGDRLGLEHYYRHPRSYRRRAVFSIDEPSPTVRGVNRPVPDGYPGHPGDTTKRLSEIRPLTTRERAMVQTFPADFLLAGSKSNLEQAVGNAVPVNLARYVARCVKKAMKGQPAPFVLREEAAEYNA